MDKPESMGRHPEQLRQTSLAVGRFTGLTGFDVEMEARTACRHTTRSAVIKRVNLVANDNATAQLRKAA